MNLMELLVAGGGGKSIDALSRQLGIDGADTGSLVEALGPALMRGVEKQTERPDSLQGLTKALTGGGHQRYLDNPELIGDDAAREDGNKILGHLFGSKDVSRNVAAQAAQKTGIESGLIKKALPMLAGLAMGALSKKSEAQAAPGSSDSGGLGGLLAGLIGDRDDDGLGMDDVLNLAKRLF